MCPAAKPPCRAWTRLLFSQLGSSCRNLSSLGGAPRFTTALRRNPRPLQVDPPADWETYIHRSGRTGRAGHTGTCITLVTRKMEYMVPIIEVREGDSLLSRRSAAAAPSTRRLCLSSARLRLGNQSGGLPTGTLAARRSRRVRAGCIRVCARAQAKGRFKFERIGAPQPAEMARIASERAVEMMADVDVTALPFFK